MKKILLPLIIASLIPFIALGQIEEESRKESSEAVVIKTFPLKEGEGRIFIEPQGQNRWYRDLQASKVQFINSALKLDRETAKEFWPLYNRFWRERESAKVSSRRALREITEMLEGNKPIDEVKLREAIMTYNRRGAIETRVFRQYYPLFLRIITTEQLARLLKAEEDFKVILLEQLRSLPKSESQQRAKPVIVPTPSTPTR